MMSDKKPDNMRIWSQVCETDPKHTKQVSFGRKFTAIDAYYQVQQSTDIFGPMGLGWWYTIDDMQITDAMVICRLSLYYKQDGVESKPITIVSAAQRKMGSKSDDDCFKKVITDCLTKALSYLGFSADVFLGQFDDNKYVQQQRAKHNQNSPQGTLQAPQWQQKDDTPKTSGKGRDEPRTDKQRSMIWAKAMGLRNKNNQLAITLIDKICEDLGVDSRNMTKTHASLVIEKLVEMEEENE
jgi:hypothetical protein